MIILGLILLLVGWATGISVLYSIGLILFVVGLILWLIGAAGGPLIGGRRWY